MDNLSKEALTSAIDLLNQYSKEFSTDYRLSGYLDEINSTLSKCDLALKSETGTNSLQAQKALQYDIWQEKTEWVQARAGSGELPAGYLGEHRADVLHKMVILLERELAVCRATCYTPVIRPMTSKQEEELNNALAHVFGWPSAEHNVSESTQTALQEPVAWRTYDGEGNYEYRDFYGNEQYQEEWNKSNPRFTSWVDPLYLPITQPTAAQDRQPLIDERIGSLTNGNTFTKRSSGPPYEKEYYDSLD